MSPTDPMTPQRLREIADEIPWHPDIGGYVTERQVQKLRAELRAHADQLERNAWAPISDMEGHGAVLVGPREG